MFKHTEDVESFRFLNHCLVDVRVLLQIVLNGDSKDFVGVNRFENPFVHRWRWRDMLQEAAKTDPRFFTS